MKEKYLKVKDNENLIRDTTSGAILNVDTNSWQAYQIEKQRRAIIRIEKEKERATINNLENEVQNIKEDIKGIESLLNKILEKLNG
jgi:predicted transcriptional regulator